MSTTKERRRPFNEDPVRELRSFSSPISPAQSLQHQLANSAIKGRRAHFNENPVAEVRSFPSPASTNSSPAQSPGPSTPPPLPDVPFGSQPEPPSHSSISPYPSPPQPRVYTPSPIPHSHTLPYIPTPLPHNVYLHPWLEAPNLRYDMGYHFTQVKLQLSSAQLAEAATHPPLPSLALRVGGLPWQVVVRPDARKSPGGAIVTVADVLSAIHLNLRIHVKPDEYNAIDKSSRAGIYEAFERRVGLDPIQRGKGLRRIDFLCGRVYAQGLVRAQSKDNLWDVVVR